MSQKNLSSFEIRAASIWSAKADYPMRFPSFLTRISAGFPSSADDFIENQLDLNELIIKHPAATFFVHVEGDSMLQAGIQSGDILVVDRAVEPCPGKIIVALLNGEFTVKRMIRETSGKVFLKAENNRYSSIEITPETDFQVWGVVTYVIHRAQ